MQILSQPSPPCLALWHHTLSCCIVGSSDWQRTALNRVAALRRLRGGTVRVGRSDYYRCCDGRRRRIRGDPLFKLEGRVERAWRKKF